MDDLRERIAYLQGLAEGLKLEEGKDEARIIRQMIDILADLIDKVEEIQAAQEDMEDYLESIDEDLYEDGEDGDSDEIEDEDEEDDELSKITREEVNYVEVECKNCHDIICFEEELLHDEEIIEIACPNCNQVVFVNDGSMPPPDAYEKAKENPGPDKSGSEDS